MRPGSNCSQSDTVYLPLNCSSSSAKADNALSVLQSCEVLVRNVRMDPQGNVSFPPDASPCWYYFAAMQDAGAIQFVEDKEPIGGYCPPADSTRLQLVRIFVNYANRNAGVLNQKAFLVVRQALRASYPCR